MTKMTISGLEKMIDDMERMSSNFMPLAEGILKDGAQIIVGEKASMYGLKSIQEPASRRFIG